MPSPSASFWSAFGTNRQLSPALYLPSLSVSEFVHDTSLSQLVSQLNPTHPWVGSQASCIVQRTPSLHGASLLNRGSC